MLKWFILARISRAGRPWGNVVDEVAIYDLDRRRTFTPAADAQRSHAVRVMQDPRFELLQAWLSEVVPGRAASMAPASADASFRRYFRVMLAHPVSLGAEDGRATSLIAMDAPPAHENCRPYVAVAALLRSAGVHAPRILAQDLENGFLLLTDLGDRTYLDALEQDSEERTLAPRLIGEACSALVRWQLASREGVLPQFDEALLRRELDLFPAWYVAKHLAVDMSDAQRATLQASFERIIANNLAQPRVYVHRDFHSRNLMVCEPNPGVLDFQDAVYGPITYDLVSLLRDAYVDWDEAEQIDHAVRYWQAARAAKLPVAADFGDFWRDFEWMGVQRQLKVLGIFARLWHRDGKNAYLKEMPRVMRYLRAASNRYRALGPLEALLDELEQRTRVTGYTF